MKHEKNLTIGIVMQSPDMGGAEIYMLSLVSEFLKGKNNILLASNKSKFLQRVKQFPIQTFEIPIVLDIIGNIRGLIKSIILLPFATLFYIRLVSKFKTEKVDVILMSNFSEKLLVSFLSIFFNIPVVWIEYGGLKTVFKKNFYIPKLTYILLKNIPKKIIVPSNNTLQSLLTEAGVSSDKIALIPCGIEIKKRKRISKEKLLQGWKGGFVVGNVSRLTREKGQEYLIKSVPYVIEKYPRVIFLIIGEGPDKIYYKKLVNKLEINNNVKILGFIKNLEDYYSIIDVFVFPTIWELEGFGLVTAEAMSYKIPVIASNLGPVPEIVDDNITGILIPPKDEKAIAETIISLIENKKRRKNFGINGYKKAISFYEIKNSSKQILKVFHNVSN